MKQKELRISDLRAGLAEVERVIRQTGGPAVVSSGSGLPLAMIVHLKSSSEIPPSAIAIDGEVLRRRRARIVYGASLGLRFAIRQKGRNFLVGPPPEDDDLLPRPIRGDLQTSTSLDELKVQIDSILQRLDAINLRLERIGGPSLERLAEEVNRRNIAEARIEELLQTIGSLQERLRQSKQRR